MICVAHDQKRLIDPTGTTPIVNAWMLDARVRMRKIEQRVKNLVTASEGVGLTPIHFRLLFDKEMVGNQDAPWWQKTIEKAYLHGIETAAKKLKQEKPSLELTDYNVIDFLVSRAGDGFATVGNELANQLAIVVQNATSVDHALEAAQNRLQVIGENRIGLLVAYSTVAAHSEATLNYFKAHGVEKVGVIAEHIPVIPTTDARKRKPKIKPKRRGPGGRFASTEALLAEFTTAGDDRVCPECAALEGKIFDIDSAYGVIPVHPNCRCDWTPDQSNIGEFDL